jgi:hypothetical protein
MQPPGGNGWVAWLYSCELQEHKATFGRFLCVRQTTIQLCKAVVIDQAREGCKSIKGVTAGEGDQMIGLPDWAGRQPDDILFLLIPNFLGRFFKSVIIFKDPLFHIASSVGQFAVWL